MMPPWTHKHIWNVTGRCHCGIALNPDGTPLGSDSEFEPKMIGNGPDGDPYGPGRGDPSEPLLAYLELIRTDWLAGRLD